MQCPIAVLIVIFELFIGRVKSIKKTLARMLIDIARELSHSLGRSKCIPVPIAEKNSERNGIVIDICSGAELYQGMMISIVTDAETFFTGTSSCCCTIVPQR